jgi:hypothetical protein
MAGTFPWGPASIAANTPTPTPPLTLAAGDNFVIPSVDLSAVVAGVSYTVATEYRPTSASAWSAFGSATGVTVGGPDHDKQGNVVETAFRTGPFPDAGHSGRQVRAIATLGVSATLSGHVTTST